MTPWRGQSCSRCWPVTGTVSGKDICPYDRSLGLCRKDICPYDRSLGLCPKDILWPVTGAVSQGYLVAGHWGSVARTSVRMTGHWGSVARTSVRMTGHWGCVPRTSVRMTGHWGCVPRTSVCPYGRSLQGHLFVWPVFSFANMRTFILLCPVLSDKSMSVRLVILLKTIYNNNNNEEL